MLSIFLAVVTPFWILDLALRIWGVPPPAWLGDSMALALMGALLLMMRRIWSERRNLPASVPSAPAVPAQSWQESLPCLVHEIRNYSSIIKGNAELLRARMGGDKALEPLGRLERTTHKIETLAQEILESATLSRVDRAESLCLLALLEACVAEHFYDTRGSFRVESEGTLPAIAGDPRKLERVFLNLFRNAREAGATHIRVRLAPAPGRMRVLVEDDGQGCGPENMAKLFRPLYTTKKDKGGTGLGLYMTKTIVEAHGGVIRAVSKNAWGGIATGLIFCLEFPVLIDSNAMDKKNASNGHAVHVEGVAG